MPMSGRFLQTYLIIFHWLHWLVNSPRGAINWPWFWSICFIWDFHQLVFNAPGAVFRLNRRYFVFMVDYPLPLKPLIAYVILTVSKRFLTKAPCVIFCGLTQMIDVVGVFLLVVLDILLARWACTHIYTLLELFFLVSLLSSFMHWFPCFSELILAFFIAGYLWTIQSYKQLKADCQGSSVGYGWI